MAEYGVFEDGEYIEGPFYGSIGRTAAAAAAKVYSDEDGAEGYEYTVKELCPDHEQNAKDDCEECYE